MSRIVKRKAARRGVTLLELMITLVVGSILMLGMLPLIRMAVNQGVATQLQMRDVLELQSLVERLSAWHGTNDVDSTKTALGGPGEKNDIDSLGPFYLHSADHVYFDTNDTVQTMTAEEAYWAAARLTSLLGRAVDGDASTPQQLRVGIINTNTLTTNYSTFVFSNGQITYDDTSDNIDNGVLFLDQVQSFATDFKNHLFEIDVRLVDANHPLISLDFFARNSL